MSENAAAAILLLLLIGMPVLGAVIARRKGRSAVAWFFLTLLLHVIGLGILVALPRLNLKCPRCGEPRRPEVEVCAGCGGMLPDASMASNLTPSGESFDQQCPACAKPYRLSDYRTDVEHIYCSGCRAELPRAAGGAPRG